jgi:hypothetical protein
MTPDLRHKKENKFVYLTKYILMFSVTQIYIYYDLATSYLHKLGYTEGQECRLCGYEKEDSVHILCDCPVLACKRYRILGYKFLKPEDLKNVRVSRLLSPVANTGLGLIS